MQHIADPSSELKQEFSQWIQRLDIALEVVKWKAKGIKLKAKELWRVLYQAIQGVQTRKLHWE